MDDGRSYFASSSLHLLDNMMMRYSECSTNIGSADANDGVDSGSMRGNACHIDRSCVGIIVTAILSGRLSIDEWFSTVCCNV